ncbi:CRE-BBS-5 protein [Caenorhabditis remanei]|uniref:CRE-BBS-5 protein n=1 Tax=Caenorhabditis remanei TaxID=31234 RepID=E3LZ78_CAERE|nr:CRE-BBS-5 protein [Caenorhabditis remanei]
MDRMERVNGEDIWQDREIRFDVDHKLLRMAKGEFAVAKVEHVEDTKGNNGDKGIMKVTNLRLIWYAMNMPRINISIGWNTITGTQSKTSTSLAARNRGGTNEAIYILAKLSSTTTKFEFIFTATSPNSHSKLFNTISSINRAYETTKMYRELKMRGIFIREDGTLRILPQEYIVEIVAGAWNLSTETVCLRLDFLIYIKLIQGSLGVFVITNIRIVWYAELNTGYNVSVPYLTLYSARVRESKFGMALVLETTASSGEYVLGFKVDPPERLQNLVKTIQTLHKAQSMKPIFGVTFIKEKSEKTERKEVTKEDEEIDIIDTNEDDVEIEKNIRPDPFAAYFDGQHSTTDEKKLPVLNQEIGLSMEPIRNGFTLQDLWAIHVDV